MPPPKQIEALLLPFDLHYVVLCVPSCGHRTGAVKWRVLEHAISTRNKLRFWPSWVSPQVVLRGALDPPTFKPFLSWSFVVCSTCWVGNSVREVIKCSRFMRRRFESGHFFQIA